MPCRKKLTCKPNSRRQFSHLRALSSTRYLPRDMLKVERAVTVCPHSRNFRYINCVPNNCVFLWNVHYYKNHNKNIVQTKQHPPATQIALQIEIMRCNFTFDATLDGSAHSKHKIERNNLRAKTVFSVFPLVACVCFV
jgi:hypothetical protein